MKQSQFRLGKKVCKGCRKRRAKFSFRGGPVHCEPQHDLCAFCWKSTLNRHRANLAVDSMVEQIIEQSKPRTLVLANVPSLTREVRDVYPGAYADFAAIYRDATESGRVVRAIAVVDGECRGGFAFKMRGFGYALQSASDVDAALIATAVRLKNEADQILLCSGNSVFLPMVELFTAVGLRVSVCAVRSRSDSKLLSICHRFAEVPLFRPQPPSVSLKSRSEVSCAA